MVKKAYILVLVLFIYSCTRKAVTIDRSTNDQPQLPTPQYVCINGSSLSNGDELVHIPDDLFFIGPLKQSVLDTCSGCNTNDFYVENDGRLGGFGLIHEKFHIDSINHIYAVVDSEISLSVLDSISNDEACDILFLHLIAINSSGNYHEYTLYRNIGSKYVMGLKILDRHFERLKINKNRALIGGEITNNIDSLFNEIDAGYSKVNGSCRSEMRCFNEYLLGQDSVYKELEKWKSQTKSAIEYNTDTTFFAFMMRRWGSHQKLFSMIESDSLSLPYPSSYLVTSFDTSIALIKYLDVSFGWVDSRLSAWVDYLGVLENRIPDAFLAPHVYVKNWLTLPFFNSRYRIMKNKFEILDAHTTNKFGTTPYEVPPKPELRG